MINWNILEIIKKNDMKRSDWFNQGFFCFGEFYKRDFEELRYRDISLFTLWPIEGKKVIDIGCGSGLYTLTFLKLKASFVYGQDICEKSVLEAISNCEKEGFNDLCCRISIGNCEELIFEDNAFDLAFSGDVFEHITKRQKINFINETFRVLKPGGYFTIKTPNKDYLKLSLMIKRIKAIFRLQNPLKIHILHTHNYPNNEHHGLTTYRELKKIFKNTMFHDPEITYQELNKKNIPLWLKKMFKKSSIFNQQIIITVRKPVFFSIYDRTYPS